MRKFILTFFFGVGGWVGVSDREYQQRNKPENGRGCGKVPALYLRFSGGLPLCSFPLFFFRVFRRAEAGDNLVPRRRVNSRKKYNYVIFSPLLSLQPAWQAFPCCFGEKGEDRGSKSAPKMARVKERKETSFLPLPSPFYISFHFSRGENPVPRLCSENKRKRLLRGLLSLSLQAGAHFVFRSPAKREKQCMFCRLVFSQFVCNFSKISFFIYGFCLLSTQPRLHISIGQPLTKSIRSCSFFPFQESHCFH